MASIDFGCGRAESADERPTPADCDNAPPAGVIQRGDTPKETNGRSGVRPSSDGSMTVEQGLQQGPSEPQIQIEAKDSAVNDIVPDSSGEGKDKADTGNGHKRNPDRTATGATGVRAPLKRTADDAGLDEGGGMPEPQKVRRTGQFAGQSAGPNRYIPRLTLLERLYRRDRRRRRGEERP